MKRLNIQADSGQTIYDNNSDPQHFQQLAQEAKPQPLTANGPE